MGIKRKSKYLKEQQKKCNLTKSNVNFNTIQPVSLDIIKPWSFTCPSTLVSLQKVNNDINSKISLCQGAITKLNVDLIVNSVKKTLIGREGIDGAIFEAAEPGLADGYQKLNVCETGECKVTLGCILSAKYM